MNTEKKSVIASYLREGIFTPRAEKPVFIELPSLHNTYYATTDFSRIRISRRKSPRAFRQVIAEFARGFCLPFNRPTAGRALAETAEPRDATRSARGVALRRIGADGHAGSQSAQWNAADAMLADRQHGGATSVAPQADALDIRGAAGRGRASHAPFLFQQQPNKEGIMSFRSKCKRRERPARNRFNLGDLIEAIGCVVVFGGAIFFGIAMLVAIGR